MGVGETVPFEGEVKAGAVVVVQEAQEVSGATVIIGAVAVRCMGEVVFVQGWGR
ncbi:hypothetical protein NBRGN_030_00040 [Nocardia brasiliensis NBRC 14402]|nr:hypothetical protein NBRGN_030_00040 [Nocardia brasiliensis NBRC 14402]